MKYLLLAFISILPLCLFGQNNYSEKVTSVSVFKNQRAFFTKTITATSDAEGNIYLKKLPEAQFGTLWINALEKNIMTIKTGTDTIQETTKLGLRSDQMRMNLNKEVVIEIRTEQGQNNQLTGRFVQIGNDYVLFKTAEGWIDLRKKDVQKIYYKEEPVFTKSLNQVRRKIQITTEDKNAIFPFELSYLQNKISWLPSYRVVILDDKNVTLQLRALLMNDAESFETDEMNFVVGVPNFRFNKILSPMVSGHPVIEIGNAISKVERQERTPQNTSNYRITFSPETYEEIVELVPEEGRESADFSGQQDFFFYTTSAVRSEKGGRAIFDVLNLVVPMEHVYTVKLKSNFNTQNKYAPATSLPTENIVTHKIKLKNTSKIPWTTGTALVLNNVGNTRPKPVSEDKLNYTSPYSSTYLKIAQTPEIQISEKEKELERTRDVQVNRSYSYNYLKVESQITIKNYKLKDVILEVTKPVVGELEKSSEKWKVTHLVNKGVNPDNTVKWQVKLKAGQEKTINYTYFVYVR